MEWFALVADTQNDAVKRGGKGKSAIETIFGGSFASQIKCFGCQTVSNKHDLIMDISLDIKNCASIEQALFRCNGLRDAQKRFVFNLAPNVLMVQLKRFGMYGRFGSKVTRHVKFAEELSLEPFLSEESLQRGGNYRYRLVGILMHAGNTCNSGHYYSYVRLSNGGYKMDDEEVSKSSISHVLSQSAYVLFYEKMDVPNPVPPLVPRSVPNDPSSRQLLNSTFFWTESPLSPAHRHNNKIEALNATISFRVTNVAASTNDQDATPPASSGGAAVAPEKHILPRDLFSATSSTLPTWNHLSTSDSVYERQRFLSSQDNLAQKRKRASKEEMEYDRPRRKGPKHLRRNI
ncbi:Ubiquitin carboxyl-terminal hydrolase 36 [Kappamyces sp. JEL0680]|nr:Ubiquitin carboxyl-terminal hydrolase 36 [Kappamyces sp. JEL0680]